MHEGLLDDSDSQGSFSEYLLTYKKVSNDVGSIGEDPSFMTHWRVYVDSNLGRSFIGVGGHFCV